jgi:L-ascorbate metabolism protein UlaG (beta-lactamase superfamily)
MAGVALTWLGHATFRIDSPGGKRVYVDPWLEGNPRCPASELEPERCDIVAVTHAHFDHVASAVDLGKRFTPSLVAMVELAGWLEKQGFPAASSGGLNKGGTVDVGGVKFTLVNAYHSSATPDGTYAGEAAGIVIELENGFRIYHAGDTCVFGDMQLIGRIYQPDVAILPIGDHYTMGPREASVALELLGVQRCIPCHWGTFPLLTGTPAALRELAPDVQILDIEPGRTIEL